MKDERAIDHDMEGAPPQFDLKTLSGDLRDAMLSRIRQMRTTWPLCTEAEQNDIANGLELAANNFVREGVRLLTSFHFPRAAVTLGEVKIKGEKGIEAKITCPNIEVYRSVLGEHVGHMVLMLMVDSDAFLNSRAKPDIQPDQADMFAAPAPEGVGDPADGELDDVPQPEPPPAADCGATFDTGLLTWAIREVVRAQDCSVPMVEKALGVSTSSATALVGGMQFFGVVAAPDKKGNHRVLCATLTDAYGKAQTEDAPGDDPQADY